MVFSWGKTLFFRDNIPFPSLIRRHLRGVINKNKPLPTEEGKKGKVNSVGIIWTANKILSPCQQISFLTNWMAEKKQNPLSSHEKLQKLNPLLLTCDRRRECPPAAHRKEKEEVKLSWQESQKAPWGGGKGGKGGGTEFFSPPSSSSSSSARSNITGSSSSSSSSSSVEEKGKAWLAASGGKGRRRRRACQEEGWDLTNFL